MKILQPLPLKIDLRENTDLGFQSTVDLHVACIGHVLVPDSRNHDLGLLRILLLLHHGIGDDASISDDAVYHLLLLLLALHESLIQLGIGISC